MQLYETYVRTKVGEKKGKIVWYNGNQYRSNKCRFVKYTIIFFNPKGAWWSIVGFTDNIKVRMTNVCTIIRNV